MSNKTDNDNGRPSIVSLGGPTTRYNYNPHGSGSFIFVSKSSKFEENLSTAIVNEDNDDQGFYDCRHHKLPYITTYLFANILEDAVASIKLLNECNNEIRVAMAEADMENLKAGKYQIEEDIVTDELATINSNNIHSDYYKLKKLENDRKHICDALECLCSDLISRMNFRLLIQKNKILTANADQKENLVGETAYKTISHELRRKLRTERQKNRVALLECDADIQKLMMDINDMDLKTSIEQRYCESWQGARTEQHELTLKNRENQYVDSINYNRTEWQKETRVNHEIRKLNDILIEEAAEKTEAIMQKYDEDMEKIDVDLLGVRNKYAEMVDRRIYLESTIKLHAEQIEKWNKFKEDRRKQLEYETIMQRSAIIVQAWWRGLIVRLQLGPYRTHSKGAGRKKRNSIGTTE